MSSVKVHDRRRWSEDYRHDDEVCRVCGSADVHSREYNKPTMDCVEYLRSENHRLAKALQQKEKT